MRPICTAFCAGAALLGLEDPALAADFSPEPAIPHVADVRYGASQNTPYAMSYSDEAAQNLGLRDGQWEAFKSSNDSLMPSVEGGLRASGPMLTLQWRQD